MAKKDRGGHGFTVGKKCHDHRAAMAKAKADKVGEGRAAQADPPETFLARFKRRRRRSR